MNKPKILVVGSLVMDNIVSTEVFPNSGQSIIGTVFRKAPGGKGANQAVQAARLGADVTMFGKAGKDNDGDVLLDTCKASGVDVSPVIRDGATHTGCAAVLLEEKPGESTKNRIIIVPGANMLINPEELDGIKARISEFDMVMLQLEIPMEINCLIAKCASEAGVPVMLNPAPSAPLPAELLPYLTYISPNEHEAADLTGISIAHDGHEANMDDVRNAAKKLMDMGVKNVLITLGSAGAVLFEGGKEYSSPCAKGITAVDPTAAGDSFIGAFCYGTCRGWAKEDVLTFANHTAALTVSAMGAMPSLPEKAAVDALLEKAGHASCVK
ncbi:MAG: ribokinase [Clostridia bacterium]|nr:ribokinase [Clostridia bacterium]MBQ1933469.1 ribokinase [Clostridia bacterium]